MIYPTNQTKPSDVSGWFISYESDTATVWEAEDFYDYYKVKFHNTSQTKYYKGETAWMDVQRDVSDAGDWNVLGAF